MFTARIGNFTVPDVGQVKRAAVSQSLTQVCLVRELPGVTAGAPYEQIELHTNATIAVGLGASDPREDYLGATPLQLSTPCESRRSGSPTSPQSYSPKRCKPHILWSGASSDAKAAAPVGLVAAVEWMGNDRIACLFRSHDGTESHLRVFQLHTERHNESDGGSSSAVATFAPLPNVRQLRDSVDNSMAFTQLYISSHDVRRIALYEGRRGIASSEEVFLSGEPVGTSGAPLGAAAAASGSSLCLSGPGGGAHSSKAASDAGELSELDHEMLIIEAIWAIRADGVREALWIQLDQVLCAISFEQCGAVNDGLFSFTMHHRVPLNNNLVTAESDFQISRWTHAERTVFVHDLEFGEIKMWSLQPATAICIANIPAPGANLSTMLCTPDAAVLFVVCGNVIELLDTEKYAKNFTQSAIRGARSGDFIRTLCGSELEEERSWRLSWDVVDRTSTTKRAFFSTKYLLPPTLLFHGVKEDSQEGQEEAAIVAVSLMGSSLAVMTSTGASAVLRHTGELTMHRAASCYPGGGSVLLNILRPPIPNHVLALRMDSQGCSMDIASDMLDHDRLLRNEINFDSVMVANQLCTLNHWDATEIQQKTLEIAMNDSAQAVYDVITDVLRGEVSPAPSPDSCTRPQQSLELLLRLVDTIRQRFDNCPEETAAKRDIKALVAAASAIASAVLSYISAGMSEEGFALLQSELQGGGGGQEFAITSFPVSGVADGDEYPEAMIPDVLLCMSLINGLRSMDDSITLHAPVTIKASAIEWKPGFIRSFSLTVNDRADLWVDPPISTGAGVSSITDVPIAFMDWKAFCDEMLIQIESCESDTSCVLHFVNCNWSRLSPWIITELEAWCCGTDTDREQPLDPQSNPFQQRHLEYFVTSAVYGPLFHTAEAFVKQQAPSLAAGRQESGGGFDPALVERGLAHVRLVELVMGQRRTKRWIRSIIIHTTASCLRVFMVRISQHKYCSLWACPAEEHAFALLNLLSSIAANPGKEDLMQFPYAFAARVKARDGLIVPGVHAGKTLDLSPSQAPLRPQHPTTATGSTNHVRAFAIFTEDNDEDGASDPASSLPSSEGRRVAMPAIMSDIWHQVQLVENLGDASSVMVRKHTLPPSYVAMSIRWVCSNFSATEESISSRSLSICDGWSAVIFEHLLFRRRDGGDFAHTDSIMLHLLSCTGTVCAHGRAEVYAADLTGWFERERFVAQVLRYCCRRGDLGALAWFFSCIVRCPGEDDGVDNGTSLQQFLDQEVVAAAKGTTDGSQEWLQPFLTAKQGTFWSAATELWIAISRGEEDLVARVELSGAVRGAAAAAASAFKGISVASCVTQNSAVSSQANLSEVFSVSAHICEELALSPSIVFELLRRGSLWPLEAVEELSLTLRLDERTDAYYLGASGQLDDPQRMSRFVRAVVLHHLRQVIQPLPFDATRAMSNATLLDCIFGLAQVREDRSPMWFIALATFLGVDPRTIDGGNFGPWLASQPGFGSIAEVLLRKSADAVCQVRTPFFQLFTLEELGRRVLTLCRIHNIRGAGEGCDSSNAVAGSVASAVRHCFAQLIAAAPAAPPTTATALRAGNACNTSVRARVPARADLENIVSIVGDASLIQQTLRQLVPSQRSSTLQTGQTAERGGNSRTTPAASYSIPWFVFLRHYMPCAAAEAAIHEALGGLLSLKEIVQRARVLAFNNIGDGRCAMCVAVFITMVERGLQQELAQPVVQYPEVERFRVDMAAMNRIMTWQNSDSKRALNLLAALVPRTCDNNSEEMEGVRQDFLDIVARAVAAQHAVHGVSELSSDDGTLPADILVRMEGVYCKDETHGLRGRRSHHSVAHLLGEGEWLLALYTAWYSGVSVAETLASAESFDGFPMLRYALLRELDRGAAPLESQQAIAGEPCESDIVGWLSATLVRPSASFSIPKHEGGASPALPTATAAALLHPRANAAIPNSSCFAAFAAQVTSLACATFALPDLPADMWNALAAGDLQAADVLAAVVACSCSDDVTSEARATLASIFSCSETRMATRDTPAACRVIARSLQFYMDVVDHNQLGCSDAATVTSCVSRHLSALCEAVAEHVEELTQLNQRHHGGSKLVQQHRFHIAEATLRVMHSALSWFIARATASLETFRAIANICQLLENAREDAGCCEQRQKILHVLFNPVALAWMEIATHAGTSMQSPVWLRQSAFPVIANALVRDVRSSSSTSSLSEAPTFEQLVQCHDAIVTAVRRLCLPDSHGDIELVGRKAYRIWAARVSEARPAPSLSPTGETPAEKTFMRASPLGDVLAVPEEVRALFKRRTCAASTLFSCPPERAAVLWEFHDELVDGFALSSPCDPGKATQYLVVLCAEELSESSLTREMVEVLFELQQRRFSMPEHTVKDQPSAVLEASQALLRHVGRVLHCVRPCNAVVDDGLWISDYQHGASAESAEELSGRSPQRGRAAVTARVLGILTRTLLLDAGITVASNSSITASEGKPIMAKKVEGGDTSAGLLDSATIAKLAPAMQKDIFFRQWLTRAFGLSLDDAGSSNGGGRRGKASLGVGSSSASPSPARFQYPSHVEEFLGEAHVVALRRHYDTMVASDKNQQHVVWEVIRALFCHPDPAAIDAVGEFVVFSTDLFGVENEAPGEMDDCGVERTRDAAFDRIFAIAVDAVLSMHYVPLIMDCAHRVFTRDRRFASKLDDFDEAVIDFFFAPGTYQGSGGLGDSSGWLCKERLLTTCDVLRKLLGSANSVTLMDKYMCASTVFTLAMFRKLNEFQEVVQLPHRSYYSRIFLEPLALSVVHGIWVLHDAYDAVLAQKISDEIASVIHVAIEDGEIELLRKVLFASNEMSLVKHFFDVVPMKDIAILSNSSPDFLLTPLHQSSVRIAMMAFFEQLSGSDGEFEGKLEMTTLYANFRHFTALGESLQEEAERMLAGFTQQSTKKSILDSTKDVIRRQNKILDEVESRLVSAANFFIQDSMYERCAVCLQLLHVISVQKKFAVKDKMLIDLTHEQAMQQLFSLEDPQDIFSVAFGYQITTDDDWAGILYRHVVHHGNRDFLYAYKAQCIAVSPELMPKLAYLAQSDAIASGGSSSGGGGGGVSGMVGGGAAKDRRQNYLWLEEQLLSVFGSEKRNERD